MKEKLKQKVKSYSFWTSLAAALVILLQSLSSVFGFAVDEAQITNIIMAICGLLVVFGVVSMPTSTATKNATNSEISKESQELKTPTKELNNALTEKADEEI